MDERKVTPLGMPISAHLAVLGAAVAVLFLAALLDPHPDAVRLFGHDVPVSCVFRNLTGHNCPGCGLTRSFAYLAHGAVWEAVMRNPLGPPFFVLVLAQVPYRILRILKLARPPTGD